MKTLIVASILALSSGAVSAEAFDFEKQLGSPDLHPTIGSPDIPQRTSGREIKVSLDDLYRGNPDVDTNFEFHYVGVPMDSLDVIERTAYDIFVEGSDADHTS
jgi:hypothetical protein